MKSKILGLFVILAFFSVGLFAIEDARLLRNPDIYGDKIVFSYAGDLWSVSKKGGDAVQLTTHPGLEGQPFYSPDGKWIAFSGGYDGNYDAYVIPAEGGSPKRLTYHPGADAVVGWSGDGKYVIFSSGRLSYSRRYIRLFKVPVSGGMPEPFPFPTAYLGDQSSDGRYYAYVPVGHAFNWWRRYRGGRTAYIWIYDSKDHSVKKVPRTKSNDTYPTWSGDNLYFLSDRDRVMNLYVYNNSNGKVTRITRFKGVDIKTYGSDGKNFVFEREGYLHLLNPETGQSSKLTVNIPGELLNTRPHFVNAKSRIFDYGISPTGKRVVVEARGEILTVPVKKGGVRNITRTPCKAERSPAWSPDGKLIAYFGEHEGEYHLKIVDQKGSKEAKIIPLKFNTYYFNLKWSPDSKKVLFNDKHLNLYYMDLEKKKPVKITTSVFSGLHNTDWSPDSNWVAYDQSLENSLRAVYLYSLKTGKSYQVTDGMSMAFDPVFDKDGKYLYFAASTDITFMVGGLDLTSYISRPTSSIYLAVLSKGEPSPFRPESDEEEVKSSEPDAKKAKKKKDGKNGKKGKDKKKPIKIDIAGIDQRIVSVKLPGRKFYFGLRSGSKGTFFFMERDRRGSALYRYNMKKRKAEKVVSGIQGYDVSADGKKLLYIKGRQGYVIPATGKAKPGSGRIKSDNLRVYSVPRLEWKQILHEAWRIQREYFYDPGMHGQDWPAIWKRYEQYLSYVSHRSDLNYIIGMMIGELAVGHAYVSGGDIPRTERVPGGLLGADFVVDDGYYKIKKIYSGENWNPRLRAPLTEPGVDVKEGDYILEVNGVPVSGKGNIYSYFEQTSGKQITIKVNGKPGVKGAREATVVPIGNELSLRHREWIKENAKKVEKMTNGKVGYVYVPDTAMGGWTYFNRYFFAQLGKHGLVVDERFNSGGKVADYIVDMLDRPLLSYWQPRDGKVYTSPRASIFGPKAMIINEWAGSGGDALPAFFRRRGVGKLVGKTTWGGLVGIGGYPPLMDGGRVTSPRFGIVSPDGKFEIENVGVPPDIEVDYTPADFIAGRDPQLEAAVKVVLEELKKNPPKKFRRDPFPRGR